MKVDPKKVAETVIAISVVLAEAKLPWAHALAAINAATFIQIKGAVECGASDNDLHTLHEMGVDFAEILLKKGTIRIDVSTG